MKIAIAVLVAVAVAGAGALTWWLVLGRGQEPLVVDTGPGPGFLGPCLWGLLYKSAAGEEGLPAEIEVLIGVHGVLR